MVKKLKVFSCHFDWKRLASSYIIVHTSQFPNRGFQLPNFSNFHRPVFPNLLRYEGTGTDMGLPVSKLSFLRVVGLEIFVADRIFDRDGLVVWPVAQLLRQTFSDAWTLEKRKSRTPIFWPKDRMGSLLGHGTKGCTGFQYGHEPGLSGLFQIFRFFRR